MNIKEIPTTDLIAELNRRLGPEEYINYNNPLEKLAWEITVLGMDSNKRKAA